jgi:hypothetical protein
VNPCPSSESNEHFQSVPTDSSTPTIGIHTTREELRLKRLHEISMIFESAFCEVRP